MSDEQKPVVMCRCGRKMVSREAQLQNGAWQLQNGEWEAYYFCDCGWRSPISHGKTVDDAIEAAYASATQRPPNLPLTKDDWQAMPEDDVVWEWHPRFGFTVRLVSHHRQAVSRSGLDFSESLFFARKPTPADIEAARREAGNVLP